MGRTIIEKIIAAHSRDQVRPGRIVWMDLDVRSARDFGGANVVAHLEREYAGQAMVADPQKTFFTFDCVAPANNIGYASNQQLCRLFARQHGVRVFDVDAGIGSHLLVDHGFAVPGATIVGTDSHLNILGAVGAFGQGMGDADIAFAIKTGRSWFEVPETVKVVLRGQVGPTCTPKDLTLFVVGRLGAKGLLGRAAELYGEAVDALDLDGRITLASMCTEMGGIVTLIPPDEAVLAFVRARAGRGEVDAVRADGDADYAKMVELDVDGLGPQVAMPGRPDDVREVTAVGEVKVDSIFIGSCTNGRMTDFEAAARVLRGRRVKREVVAVAAPATRRVYGEMMRRGLLEEFYEAGVIVSTPGCGGCASGQVGMTGKGEVQVSTSNRNFPGKQGAGRTYLASPATAAASAVSGRLCAGER